MRANWSEFLLLLLLILRLFLKLPNIFRYDLNTLILLYLRFPLVAIKLILLDHQILHFPIPLTPFPTDMSPIPKIANFDNIAHQADQNNTVMGDLQQLHQLQVEIPGGDAVDDIFMDDGEFGVELEHREGFWVQQVQGVAVSGRDQIQDFIGLVLEGGVCLFGGASWWGELDRVGFVVDGVVDCEMVVLVA